MLGDVGDSADRSQRAVHALAKLYSQQVLPEEFLCPDLDPPAADAVNSGGFYAADTWLVRKTLPDLSNIGLVGRKLPDFIAHW